MKIALSWSRIAVFRECPYKFKEQFITKTYPDDSNNPAFVKGKEVHDQVDKYIKHKDASKLGVIAKNAKDMVDGLPGLKGELQAAVSDNWSKVDWFSKNIMFRAIYDAVYIDGSKAIILDWKTGKVQPYDQTRGQLHLSAAILFELNPQVDQIKSCYAFLEHEKVTANIFNRADHAANKAAWQLEAIAINEETEFAPKKNKYCYFCLSTTCPLKQ